MRSSRSDTLATAQVTDAFRPILDGVSVTVASYAGWLQRRLGETVVVAPSAPGHRDAEEFAVVRYPSLPVWPRPPYRFGLPRLDPTLGRRLARHPVDLVHCHSPFSAAPVARRLARRRGVPLVATFHSKYRDDLEGAVPWRGLVDARMRRIVRFFEAADEVWIPSEAAVETLRGYGYRGRVEVVPHGIDLEPPADPAAARGLADRVMGTRPDERVLLYVGQMVWEKDLEVLLRALAELAEAGESFTAVLVGEGYARRGLAELGAGLGLSRRLRFAGVVRDRRALQACYARAELFVFPSRYDTSGLVVREAAAVELPAVLARGADTAEGVVDGVNGFLAEPGPEGFAAAVGRGLADRERRRRCGREAARTLCRSWQVAVDEVADRYRVLVATHQCARSRPIRVPRALTSSAKVAASD